jgi:hypothetical protein
MAARAPRHLAEPPRRFGLSPLQRVFLAAMLSLATITAVVALVTRDAGNGGRRAAGPATTRSQTATTASTARAVTTTTAPASTEPATRPVRPTPGNLLADGDFERDLAGWAPLGEAGVERVEGGASGRWAAAVTPGGPGAARPGMVRRDAATTEAGTTYEAVLWVKAPEGGQVVLALRELDGGREVSADRAGYALDSDRWQQLAVEHRTAAPGSRLALEVVGYDLGGEGRLLVDGVDLQTE